MLACLLAGWDVQGLTWMLCFCSSYQLLDDMVDRAREGDPSAVERIPDVLQFTMAHVDTFESLIERCLDLPISNVAPAAPLPI